MKITIEIGPNRMTQFLGTTARKVAAQTQKTKTLVAEKSLKTWENLSTRFRKEAPIG